MKISKKILIVFIIATIASVLTYLYMGAFTINLFSRNEEKRSASITNTVIGEIRGELEKLACISKIYGSDIENQEDIVTYINDKNQLNDDEINYKIILSSDYENIVLNDNKNEEYNNIIEVSKNLIKKNSKESISGIINTNKYPYLFNVQIINLKKEGEKYYFITAKCLDEKLISEIGRKIRRKINILDNIDGKAELEHITMDNNIDMFFCKKGNVIESYIILDKLYGDKNYYISLEEPKYVENIAINTIVPLISVLILIILLLNIIVYFIIKKQLINRIQKTSIDINNIMKKNNKNRVPVDNINDEITDLRKDINSMLDRIHYVNNSLKINEKKYRDLVTSMTNGYIYLKLEKSYKKDLNNAIIIEINSAAKTMLNFIKDNVIDKKLSDILIGTKNKGRDIISLLNELQNKDLKYVESEFNISENKWVSISIYSLEEGYVSMVLNDITDIKKYAEEMRYLANYDTLTTLINRYQLNNLIIDSINKNIEFSIIFIDLDNFKNLNDTLGHNVGDGILCVVANVLNKLSNDKITISRFGGDEFVILRKGKNKINDIEELTENILNSINKTFKFKNYEFQLKASGGVSFYPEHATEISTLLKYADIAMYKSKASGGNIIKIFEYDMLSTINIENKIKNAIEKQEFEVYYQGIYDLKSNKVIGSEALVRWASNDEIICPDEFIYIAKKTGDIVAIDNFVLQEAFKFCKEYLNQNNEGIEVSINISQRTLMQNNFINMLQELLLKYELSSGLIKLEITEDEIIENTKNTIIILNEIQKLGVKISLDDFGTGYSSFNYIKTLPLDVIKIDRSLITNIEDDRRTLAIIETLINLCHELELEVICEGVEEKCQLELLKKIKCDKIQGYYISKPVPLDEFKHLIKRINNL